MNDLHNINRPLVTVWVLGRFEAEVDGHTVDLGGARQRAVLAMLLIARGDVVSVDRLLDDVWQGAPPPRARSALQAYVSRLRRALEPQRSPRAVGNVVASVAPGYALRVRPEGVDAWRFEALVREAERQNHLSTAYPLLEEALALWRGSAFAAFATAPWALGEITRLTELRAAAAERRIDAAIAAGHPPAQLVVDAEELVRKSPLREEGWRLLALTQYLAGQQADALATLRRVRNMLAEEMGLDPGPALSDLEHAVRTQQVAVRTQQVIVPTPVRTAEPRAFRPRPRDLFVGRVAELTALHEATKSVRLGIALVTGEPGSGKTALLERLGDDLAADGWLVCMGRCPEIQTGQPGWAWAEALRALAAIHDPGARAEALAPFLADRQSSPAGDAMITRARLHQALCDWLLSISEAPVAILLDDVHRGDVETLSLLRSVAERVDRARLLLVTAYRDAETSPDLIETVAVLASRMPTRIALTGLNAAEAAQVVVDIYGRAPDPELTRALFERTDGNPFYLRESARLLAAKGADQAMSEVPDGVRDVLSRRFTHLPSEAVTVLRIASVIGRDVEIELLVRAAEHSEAVVLDALEAGLSAGLLTEPRPGWVRFGHLLVRETLYAQTPVLRRTRWHQRVADTLVSLHCDDLTALAHHHVQAVTFRTAATAISYSIAAAAFAESRFAYDTAAEWYGQALRCLDIDPAATNDRRVELLGRLTRSLHAAGATAAALDTRDDAIAIAEISGRDDLLLEVIASWDVPTAWLVRPYGTSDQRMLDHLRRMLDQPVGDATRSRLLSTVVRETSSVSTRRAIQAADEAIAAARRSGDPHLLCRALSEAATVRSADLHVEARAEIDAEMMQLAQDHGLIDYVAIAHMLAAQSATRALNLSAVRGHVAAARTLAEQYQLRQSMRSILLAEGMLAHIAGQLDDAELCYQDAADLVRRHGGVDADRMMLVSLTTLRITQERERDLLPGLRVEEQSYGRRQAGDRLAIALAAQGKTAEAQAVRVDPPPLQHNYLWSLNFGIRALAVIAVGDRDAASACYQKLLPHRGVLAGGATAAWTTGPVAEILASLAVLLGQPDVASGHYDEAMAVAERCGAPLWAKRIQDRRNTLT